MSSDDTKNPPARKNNVKRVYQSVDITRKPMKVVVRGEERDIKVSDFEVMVCRHHVLNNETKIATWQHFYDPHEEQTPEQLRNTGYKWFRTLDRQIYCEHLKQETIRELVIKPEALIARVALLMQSDVSTITDGYSESGLKDLQDIPKELLNISKVTAKYNAQGAPAGCVVEFPSPESIVKMLQDTVAIDEEFRKRLALSEPVADKPVSLNRR